MKRHFVILLAVSVAVTATTASTTPSPPNTCIPNCKCQDQEEFSSGTHVKEIFDCQNPITLNSETFTENAKNIGTLQFENVIIIKIDNDTFTGFNNLDMIMFKNSSIGSIDSSAFNLPELGTVSFTGTTFGQVPALISDYIETLIFTNCKLSEIPNLDQLPSLAILQLENNYIRTIPELAFAKLESLEELTLTNNSISVLPPNVFEANENLNTLNFDNNPLESFTLSKVSNLEHISLKSCKLKTFDENASKNLDLVNYLDLSNNQIWILPIDAFTNMRDLNYIDLSNNQLVEISDDIFEDNSRLEKIVLDGNKFEKLPQFVCNDTYFNTYFFSCNNCGLKSINGAFKNMPGIVTLILANNQINEINGVFDEIHGLKELDLSHNQIETVGLEAFVNKNSLETLDLSGNPLKPLDPVVFASITMLKKLNISNAGLAQLWANHNSILPSLERLLIRNNKLTTITVDDLNVAPKLKLIDLKENHLVCSKDLHDSVLWLTNKAVYPIQGADRLKTHEEILLSSDVAPFEDVEQDTSWKDLAYEACNGKTLFDDFDDNLDNSIEVEKNPTYTIEESTAKPDSYDDDDYFYSEEYNDEYEEKDKQDIDKNTEKEEYDTNILFEETIVDPKQVNLARASYILSLTSVFIVTALVVLTVAVAVTLFVLKKNGAFSKHNGDLPRLKIPLWHTTPTQKKHSGSVYKPLSEDFSGPKTPIINRYEFKSTPAVHHSTP